MDDQSTASDNAPDQRWIRRQWHRVRDLWARDVVIGQVGEGAANVIIGKNNIQINIGGHNITLPIWLIALSLFLILGVLVYPAVDAYLNPPQMTKSGFGVIVTEFSEINGGWFTRRSTAGKVLSDRLAAELSALEEPMHIQVWYDDPESSQNKLPRFGRVITSAQAEHLAKRHNATLVIYGVINRAVEPVRLELNFYYNRPSLVGEAAANLAHHAIGKPLPVPYFDDVQAFSEKVDSDKNLNLRFHALTWLVRGLAKDLVDEYEDALAIFNQAEVALPDWEDGKELLYFFKGREYFLLQRLPEAEAAFSAAIARNPQYINAYLGRGNLYFDLAQRGLLQRSSAPLTIDSSACAAEAANPIVLDAASLPTTTAEIMAYIERAFNDATYVADTVRQQLAPNEDIAPIKLSIAQWMIANSYRLKADLYLYEQQFDLAEPALAAAETALTTALETFAADQTLVEFAIQTRYHLGLVKRAQGYRAKEGYGDWQASAQWYQQAQDEFTQCVDKAEQQWPQHPRFFVRSPRCSCQALAAEVEQSLQELETQQGGDG